ncbi:MAG: pilus assembly protein TadG-related protein [Acidimicrobiia bacterium]
MFEPQKESGFSAIWVALCLLFLLAATALAVDVSGFYETARTDQTTADLACLAGIPSMPEDPAVARASAAENAQRNFPSLAAVSPSTSGNTLTLSDAFGNSVAITAPFGADNNKMQVTVTETDQATFGRVIGASDVPITQVAYCKVFSAGGGTLPFGALPGGWAGGLQAPNPCGTNSGNCGALFIDRIDGTNGNNNILIKNISEGSDRELTPWLGPLAAGSNHCTPSNAVVCHIVDTDTGVSAGALGTGFVERFDDDPKRSCTMVVSGEQLNCDSPSQVLGSAPQALFAAMGGVQPAWWDTSLYGPWTATDTAAHHYWNDVIAKCDSPRFGAIPIVSSDMNWDLGDPNPGWPNGKKDMKIIGMYNVIITDPNDTGDFHGNGNLKQASSILMWYGPNARCVGPSSSNTPFAPGSPKTYRLVDANA